MKARANGIHIKSYQAFYDEGPKSDIKTSIDALASTGVRIVFIAAEKSAQLVALTVAAHHGYINNNTVWITIDTDVSELYKSIEKFNNIIEHRVNKTDIVPEIYNATLIDEIPSGNKEKQILKKQSLSDVIDPIEYAARLTNSLTPIDYYNVFSGGVFLINNLRELKGYPPFDHFIDKWSHLNSSM